MGGPKPNSRRLSLLVANLERGGAERTVVDLAMTMRERGWDASIACLGHGNAFESELASARVSVASFGIQLGRANLAAGSRLVRYFQSVRPVLIHGHMFHANVAARALGRLFRIPVVCTIHSVRESNRRKDTARLRSAVYRLTDRFCFRTTAVSECVSERLLRDRVTHHEKLQAIPSFVDANLYRPESARREQLRRAMGWNDSFVWLAVGRLDKAKDYPNLIASFRRLRDAPAARLAIAGDGSEREAIESLIERLNLRSRVTLLGMRTDIPDLLNASDAFVQASAWEGMPISLLEAAACELPIVTTEVGGTAEVVQHGRTGLLVPPGDAEQLSTAMQRIVCMAPAERASLARTARRHVVEKFSIAAVCDRYESLYMEALAASRS